MQNSWQATRRMGKANGFSFVTLMLMIGLVGAIFSMLANTLPKVYECFLLRELADRVVKEYAALPIQEVQRRVQFEMHRSQLTVSEETFKILPIGHGYRVTVYYPVPLELRIGDEVFPLKGYEKYEFRYEVES